jgi:hypothetical protein
MNYITGRLPPIQMFPTVPTAKLISFMDLSRLNPLSAVVFVFDVASAEYKNVVFS